MTMRDTSKGCILWFCLIWFLSVNLVEWKRNISSPLAWLRWWTLHRGKTRWKEFSCRTWIAWSWVELTFQVFMPRTLRQKFNCCFGTMKPWESWLPLLTLRGGAFVYCILLLLEDDTWCSDSATPFSRHSFRSCLLQPFQAWSQQRIHRKLNGLLQLQLKLPQGEGETEKDGRLFKCQTYPSLTSCDVFRGTSIAFFGWWPKPHRHRHLRGWKGMGLLKIWVTWLPRPRVACKVGFPNMVYNFALEPMSFHWNAKVLKKLWQRCLKSNLVVTFQIQNEFPLIR